MRANRAWGFLLGVSFLLSAGFTAKADTVKHQNGNVVVGRIVEEKPDYVVIDTGTSKLQFKRSVIVSITREASPEFLEKQGRRALERAKRDMEAGKRAEAARTLEAALQGLMEDTAELNPLPPSLEKLSAELNEARQSALPRSSEAKLAEERFQQALLAINHIDYAGAFKFLKEAARLDSARADIQFRLGECAQQINQMEVARNAFARSLELAPEIYYRKVAEPLLKLVRLEGRRLLGARKPEEALPLFQQMLLLQSSEEGAPVSVEDFIARQTTRKQQTEDEILMEIYKYADDSDLIDLALAAVTKASELKPNDPELKRLATKQGFFARYAQAIAKGDLGTASAMLKEDMAASPDVAERIRDLSGTIGPEVEAKGLLEAAEAALAAKDFPTARAKSQEILSNYTSTESAPGASEVIRIADREEPIGLGIGKILQQVKAKAYDEALATIAALRAEQNVKASTRAAEVDALEARVPREREADRLYGLARVSLDRQEYDKALIEIDEIASKFGDTDSGAKAISWLNDYRSKLVREAEKDRLFEASSFFAFADPALWRAADASFDRKKLPPVTPEGRSAAWKLFDDLHARDSLKGAERRSKLLHLVLPILLAGIALAALLWRLAKPGSGQYIELDQLKEREARLSGEVLKPESFNSCRMCGQTTVITDLVCPACGTSAQESDVEHERSEDHARKVDFDPWDIRTNKKDLNRFDEFYQKARDLAQTSDVQAAIENCRRALAEDPLSKDGFMLLADLYSRVGKGDDAATCYREVLLIDPAELVVRQKIESLLSLSGQPVVMSAVHWLLAVSVWWTVFWLAMALGPIGSPLWIAGRVLLSIAGAVLTVQLWGSMQRKAKRTITKGPEHLEVPHALPQLALSWKGQDRQAEKLANAITAHTGIEVPVLRIRRLFWALGLSFVCLVMLMALAWVNKAPWALLAWPGVVGILVYVLEIHPRAYTAYALLRHLFEETSSSWADPHRPFTPKNEPVLGEFLMKTYSEFPLRWALKPFPYGSTRQGILNSLQQTLNRHWECHRFYGALRVVRDFDVPSPKGLKLATGVAGLAIVAALGGTIYFSLKSTAVEQHYQDSLRRGYLELLEGNVAESREYLRDAIMVHGDRALPYLYLAHSSGLIANGIVADLAFQEAIRRGDNMPVLHNDYGNFLQRSARLREAIAQYDLALKLDPKNADMLSNLGSAAYKAKEYEKAIVALRGAVGVNPTHTRAHTTLGLALEGSGKWEEARKSFEEAVKVAPTVPYTEVSRKRLEEKAAPNLEELQLEQGGSIKS